MYTREFTVTKVLEFFDEPESASVDDSSNDSYAGVSWVTNFTPSKIEVYSNQKCIASYTQRLSSGMSVKILADKKTAPEDKFIRAYYGNGGYYVDSEKFTVTKDYKFVAQPSDIGIGLNSDDEAGEISWTVNFVPVKLEIYSNGVLADSFAPAAGSTGVEFSREVTADPVDIAADKFARAYYSETGYLDSTIFRVTKVYGFLTQPQSVQVATNSTSTNGTVSWSANFVPIMVRIYTENGTYQDVDKNTVLAKNMSLSIGADHDNAIKDKFIRLYYSSDIFFDSQLFVVYKHFHEFMGFPEKPATCFEEGHYAYYVCTLDNCGRKFWDEDGLNEITDDDDLIIPINPSAHVWGAAEYVWAADYSTCTATRTCQLNDTHIESEEATAQSTVEKVATCSETGIKKYTATFTNSAFETQYKEEVIAVNPDAHEWGEWKVTTQPTVTSEGEKQRVCKHNPNHIEKVKIDKLANNPAFTITAQPQNATVYEKEQAYFEVVASAGNLSYSWEYKYAGSDRWIKWTAKKTAQISVAYGEERNGMSLRCTVTDANGCFIVSDEAVLEYIKKPVENITITVQPKDTVVAVNKSAYFSVAATTTASSPELSYLWQYKYAGETSWTDWTTKTTAKIGIAYNANKNGMSVRCVVTDANGKTAISSSAVLTYK